MALFIGQIWQAETYLAREQIKQGETDLARGIRPDRGNRSGKG